MQSRFNRVFSIVLSIVFSFSIFTYFPKSNIMKVSASASSVEQEIYNFLINDMGFNVASACGVLANIENECSFDINKIETGNGAGYGICQWTGSRRTDLINYCNKNNYDYKTLNGQLHFLQNELQKSYNSVYNVLKSVANDETGAFRAGSEWCMNFEKPYYRQMVMGQYDKYGNPSINGGYNYYPSYPVSLRIQKISSEKIGKTESEYRGWLAQTKYWSKYNNGQQVVNTWIGTDDYNGDYLTITNLNLRSGPSTSYSIIMVMKQSQKVTVTKSDGSWAYINCNGIEGYCSMEYLTKNISPSKPGVNISSGTSNTNTVFSWNSCENTEYYDLTLYDSNNVAILTEKGLTSLSYSKILSSGEYYVLVTAVCSNGSRTDSDKIKFVVDKVYPSKPTVEISAGNSKSNTNISWNKCIDTDSYDLVIYKSNNVEYKRLNSITDTYYSDIIPSGDYYAIVTSKNNLDNTTSVSDKKQFTVVTAVPSKPSVSVLAGNNYTNTKFDWNVCDYADKYLLEIFSKDDNKSICSKTLTDVSYSLIISTPGNYYAKVSSINSIDNEQTFSDVIDFYVEPADVTDFTVSITGKTDSVVKLEWTQSLYATEYKIYRYENEKYTLIGTTSELSFIDTGLYSNTNYKYYVNSSNEWSNKDSNQVSTTTLILPLNGSGTESNPYIVSSAEDLQIVSELVNGSDTNSMFTNSYYKQTSNIDLSDIDFVPIGTIDTPFSGNYNGNYFEISGLNINSNDDYIGLFGYCDGENTNIHNIVAYGNISSKGNYIGGIVGSMNLGKIENCAFYGNISGNNNIGGIVGSINNDNEIIRCYQLGLVTGNVAIGGIVGQSIGSNNKVSYCYHANGTITGNSNIGGILGKESNSTMYTDCYYLKNNSSYGVDNTNNSSIIAVNETVLKNLSETLGKPFTIDNNINNGYPVFEWQVQVYEFKGHGTVYSPYQIENVNDLVMLSKYVNNEYLNVKYANAYYIQTSDIDLSNINFTPIGTKNTPFNGSYNGGYRNINNINTSVDNQYGGLFGYADNIQVSNLVVYGNINSNEVAGGIVGETSNNINLSEVSFIGDISSAISGGLVGKVNVSGTIKSCYQSGTINGTISGGLIGKFNDGGNVSEDSLTLKDSYHGYGIVNCGIVGETSNINVILSNNCYYLKTSSSNGVGGKSVNGITPVNDIVLSSLSETLENSFANDDNSLNNGYPVFEWQMSMYEFEGSGTEDDPYLIGTKDDLIALQEYVNNPTYNSLYGNAYYEQITDIDLQDIQWTAIGVSDEYPFNGVYNGRYFTIYGLNAYGENYSGLFGQVGSNEIGKNAKVKNLIIKYGSSCSATGVVGGTSAVLMNGATIDNCGVIGDLSGNVGVGGVVGIVYKSGYITNSYHNGDVLGNGKVGGILGSAESGTATIENCYHTVGKVTSNGNCGAIVGYVNSSTNIENCYYLAGTSNGAVDGKSFNGITVVNETVLKNLATTLGDDYIDNIFTYYNDGFPILYGELRSNYLVSVIGDINLDDDVTYLDLILIKKYILSIIKFNSEQFNLADINDDGSVNVLDFMLLKNMLF